MNFFCRYLVFAVFITTAWPAHAVGLGECESFIRPPNWERIFDVTGVSQEEAEQVRDMARFFDEAYSHRAEGEPLSTLRSPFLSGEGRRLSGMIESMLRVWNRTGQLIQAAFDETVRRAEREVREKESKIRSGGRLQLVKSKRDEIKDVLIRSARRLGLEGRPEDVEETFNFALNALSESPEADLFQGKQDLAKLRAHVRRMKPKVEAETQRTFALLSGLHEALNARLAGGKPLSWLELFQFQFLTAGLFEFSRINYGLTLSPERSSHPQTEFEEMWGLDFRSLGNEITQWVQQVQFRPDARLAIEEVDQEIKKLDGVFAGNGMVTVPVMATLSRPAMLAFAFLPMQPVRFHLQPGATTEHLDLVSGSQTFVFDLGGAAYTIGYDAAGLREETRPNQWRKTIERSWRTWFVLLGGRLNPVEPPLSLKRGRPHTAKLVPLMLYVSRFLGIDENATDWSDLRQVTRLLHNDFLFWELEKDVTNSNVVSYFEREGYSEQEIAAALDLMFGRLLHETVVEVSDPGLRVLIEKFPTSSITAKLLVLRSLHPKTESRGEPGGPAF